MTVPGTRAKEAARQIRTLLPEIPAKSGTDPTSYYWNSTPRLPALPAHLHQKLRSAVISGDPIDVARDWQNYSFQSNAPPESTYNFPPTFLQAAQPGAALDSSHALAGCRAPPVYRTSIVNGGITNRVLMLNTANHRIPGGEWEQGVLAQEENTARRSNLVQVLVSLDPASGRQTYYPLAGSSGVYSPNVVIFREGSEGNYIAWPPEEWTVVSVVSVSSVCRPKLDESGAHYSFQAERDLQHEKMRTILRIAALNGHVNLVLGGFGSADPRQNSTGLHRNPVGEVAAMWKDLLFEDWEFKGWFRNVVFAFNSGGDGWMEETSNTIENEFKKYFG